MPLRAPPTGGRWGVTALLATGMCVSPPALPALTDQEIAALCRDADGTAHCGKLIEHAVLDRHPGVASRVGGVLRINLARGREIDLADGGKASPGGLDYSLWDVLDAPGYAVVWAQEADASRYLLVDREDGHIYKLPGEPMLAPDRSYFACADFCARGCVNELSLWKVEPHGLRRSATYRPAERWVDAGVRWQNRDTLLLDVQVESDPAHERGGGPRRELEVKLNDSRWSADAP